VIYEYAIDPALVATWHDRSVAYPVLCQMGRGLRRVPCAFPAAAWKTLVTRALQETVPGTDTAEGQRARKNIEILLRHLHEIGTRRNGRLGEGEPWLEAALREHDVFPFGGILVRSSTAAHPALIATDRMAEQTSRAWDPPAAPVARQPKELARALAPLLRCATQLRFVDPYFDAEDPSFFEPMKEYLLAAQQRRSAGELQVQIHLAIRPEEIHEASRLSGRRMTERDVAAKKVEACEKRLGPLLKPGVTLRAFAWGESASGVKMHNRYVLAEIGGVAVQTGLDQSIRAPTQTDDLTILSSEQHAARWSEHSAEGTAYRPIADRKVTGAATGSRS